MDSTAVFLIVMFALVAIVAAVLISIMRKRNQAGGTGPNDTGTTAAEESSSGRPLYKDPDPEGMAGGRARFTPPGSE